MKVLGCYTSMHGATRSALGDHAPNAELINVSGDEYAYYEAVAECWTGEEDLVIVEQDIAITSETLPSFLSCPEPWCMYSYYVGFTPISVGIGCARFTSDFQRAYPIKSISEVPLKWHEIDSAILMSARGGPHIHGLVDHYHRYSVAVGWSAPQEGIVEWKYATYEHNGVAASSPKDRPQFFTVVNGKIVD